VIVFTFFRLTLCHGMIAVIHNLHIILWSTNIASKCGDW